MVWWEFNVDAGENSILKDITNSKIYYPGGAPTGPIFTSNNFVIIDSSSILNNIFTGLDNNPTTPWTTTDFPPENATATSGDYFCNATGSTYSVQIYDLIASVQRDKQSINNNNYRTATFDNTMGSLSDQLVCCIHPSAIVDLVDTPISELNNYPDSSFKKVLKLGFDNKFVRIKQGALGENKPTHDLLLTKGHPIIINEKEIKAGELINNDTIILEDHPYTQVYALMFENRITVKMHGVDVVQWEEKEFNQFCEDNNLTHNENGFRPKNL
jgi:hypothetical protein